VLLNESNAKLLCRGEDRLVILATTRRRNILYTRPTRAEHVVNERELDDVNRAPLANMAIVDSQMHRC